MRVLVALPRRWTAVQELQGILGACGRLRTAFGAALPSRVEVAAIAVYLNGPAVARHFASVAFHVGGRADDGPLLLRTVASAGKIPAMNAALTDARSLGCDALLCIDDDIYFDRWTLHQLVDTWRTQRFPDAVTARKAPYVPRDASAFQRLYSFAVALSFQFDLFPKRPTGSCYLVSPWAFPELPEGCNEGDFFALSDAIASRATVYSPYPSSFDAEVARRRRLSEAAASLSYLRAHSDPAFLTETRAGKPPLPRAWLPAYQESLGLWIAVHEAETAVAC